VKVLSANGTVTNGVGDKVRRKLLAANYDALTAVTATNKTKNSVVYFTPGFESEAGAVAVVVGVPATAVQAMPAKPPVPQLGSANVLVVAGDDIVATLVTTSTTVKSTTATTRRTTTTAKSGTTTTAKSGTTTTKATSSSTSSTTG
jgi:hypothetical protein